MDDMRDRLIEILREPKEIDEGVEALADYLIANGVIVPPCKVGDTVYRISTKHITKMRNIQETKICRIAITKEGIQFFCECNSIAPCIYGKTVFLTKEEAEQALKERESGG